MTSMLIERWDNLATENLHLPSSSSAAEAGAFSTSPREMRYFVLSKIGYIFFIKIHLHCKSLPLRGYVQICRIQEGEWIPPFSRDLEFSPCLPKSDESQPILPALLPATCMCINKMISAICCFQTAPRGLPVDGTTGITCNCQVSGMSSTTSTPSSAQGLRLLGIHYLVIFCATSDPTRESKKSFAIQYR